MMLGGAVEGRRMGFWGVDFSTTLGNDSSWTPGKERGVKIYPIMGVWQNVFSLFYATPPAGMLPPKNWLHSSLGGRGGTRVGENQHPPHSKLLPPRGGGVKFQLDSRVNSDFSTTLG